MDRGIGMMQPPVLLYFPDERPARLVVNACRNEATAFNALQRFDDAAVMNRIADQVERSIFAVRDFVNRSEPHELCDELSANVEYVGTSYRNGEDVQQRGGSPIP